jgi:hypothetical protein
MRATFSCLRLLVGGTALLLSLGCALTRAGYETAPYTVVRTEPPYEIRDYPALPVVSTSMDPAARGRDGSFGRLFRYIDGGNAPAQNIAMTTPVFMAGHGQSKGTMSFVLPAEVASTGAPAPVDDGVQLAALPARRVAVVRFSGTLDEPRIEAELARLRAWMAAQPLPLESAGEPLVAGYDPPFTPPPLRRNEVLLPLVPELTAP